MHQTFILTAMRAAAPRQEENGTLEGVLGTTGEGVKDAQNVVVEYLKDTGVYYRI